MGNFWVVLMCSKESPRNTPPDMQIAFTAQKTDESVLLGIIMDFKNVTLLKQNDNFYLLDQNELDNFILIPPHESYELKGENGKTFVIFTHVNNEIEMSSNVYETNVQYNGERIRISVSKSTICDKLFSYIIILKKHIYFQASSKYRNAIRGLCGNFDKQSNNDYLSPRNCIANNLDEFVAEYSLTDEYDQSISRAKEKAERLPCTEFTQSRNIISDGEAGRLTSKPVWGYHSHSNQNLHEKNIQENVRTIYRTKVEKDAQQVCFSIEPVPTCPENSEPVSTKLMEVPFICMAKGPALRLESHIEYGANPSLSHKSPSKKENREIPTACKITNLSYVG